MKFKVSGTRIYVREIAKAEEILIILREVATWEAYL
jgi:hypothetical protein